MSVRQPPKAVEDSLFGPDKLYLVTRAYTLFLQRVFSAWPSYCWDADPSKTKVVITTSYPDTLTVETRMPLIVVNNNGGQWRGPSYGQELYGSVFRPAKLPRLFADTILSSVTIYVFATSEMESSKLAWNIFKAIPLLRHQLQRMRGVGMVNHRLSIGRPRDASSMVQGVTPGIAWVTTVYSPVDIHEETVLVGNLPVENILDDVIVRPPSNPRD